MRLLDDCLGDEKSTSNRDAYAVVVDGDAISCARFRHRRAQL